MSIAVIIKLIPYLVTLRAITGTIDIAVHAIKVRISKQQ